jgi:glycosyltransferase involved in cell wall biosynthesis
MKVLEIINSLGTVGGAENFAVNFCGALSKKCDLTVVILYNQNSKILLNKMASYNIRPIILNKKRHLDFKIIKRLRRIIKINDIDFIHTENNALISAVLACRFLKKRPKIFHTIHNPSSIEAGGKISSLLYNHFFRASMAYPVAISALMAKDANSFYKATNIPFIGIGINIDAFTSPKPLSKRDIDCAVLARFEEQKNHSFLVDVFSLVKQKNERLSVVMTNKGSLFDAISNKIQKEGLGDNIKLVGEVDSTADILNNSKMLVLGSHFEGNPQCVLEALAAGCIIISTSVGGIPDIVENGKNGFLFRDGEISGFSKTIENISLNSNEYQSMSEYNKIYAKTFSIDSIAEQYINLFLSNQSIVFKKK